jgi:hypothetical protein
MTKKTKEIKKDIIIEEPIEVIEEVVEEVIEDVKKVEDYRECLCGMLVRLEDNVVTCECGRLHAR